MYSIYFILFFWVFVSVSDAGLRWGMSSSRDSQRTRISRKT